MHDKPHALFHEPSLREAVASGSVAEVVLFGILGLAARFSDDAEIRNQAPSFTEAAKCYLKSNLEHSCVENIQACILIGNICLGDSDPDAESIYFVIANRMAQISKLNVLNDVDDGITRETKLRLWWTCYLVDTWASGGSGLPRQFNILNMAPRLPMDEEVFSSMRPGDADVPACEWRPGFWGYNVKMSTIYSNISDLTKRIIKSTVWDEESIEEAVREAAVELTAFEESLPTTMRYSPSNLTLQVERGLGRNFIALHLGFNHYATLLYYQYLDRNRPSTTNGAAYAQRCKHHATLFSEILEASRNHGGAEALYNIVGHVTVVSSSVLLHSFLFGDPNEVDGIRQRLESNFESLVQLRRYWPSVELMINRLIVFQRSCLRSETSNTHRLDKWMVKFLLQHALALDDKELEENTDGLSSWPLSVLDSYVEPAHVDAGLIERSRRAPSPQRLPPADGFEVLDNAYLLEEETYSWYSPEETYHVRIGEVFQSRYQVLGKLGFGSVSTAWLCRDLIGHEYVTLKVFISGHRQAQNEEKVYRYLETIMTNHPGVARIRSLRDSFQLPGIRESHECLIHDALGLTLGEIREMSDGQKVSTDLLKPFTKCLLVALDFLHTKAHVVHTGQLFYYLTELLHRLTFCGADIQEGNVMLAIKDDAIFKTFEQEEMDEPSLRKVDGDRVIYASRALDVPDDASHVVLCDFGDAQFGSKAYGGEVMPDLYRAPEIVLGIPWNEKIDIWAVGMMVWDLYEGKHMFKERLPSTMESVPAHIARMIALMGPPPVELLKRGQFSYTFFDEDGELGSTKRVKVHLPCLGNFTSDVKVEDTSLEEEEENSEGEQKTAFLKFLRGIVQWVLEERNTARELMNDPWINIR
ncbi:hypothetical protein V492_07560 [Pseudogymnoascus sp. VKM F-4246]|nr:hypothetical protein V492_07560 [Pseudogymnoascus sp. VKM F-4246]